MISFGKREPSYRSVPSYASSHGNHAIKLAAQGGLILDPWQEDILVDSMGVDVRGNWAATEVGVIVPRQNGKGSILEALVAWWLLTQKDVLVLWSAHEFKTAREAFLRVQSLFKNSKLGKHVAKYREGKGEEAIEMDNCCDGLHQGTRLRFVARSQISGRGFTGDLIILDEAFALTDDQMAALLPTLSARKHIQIWYTSSAPLLTSAVLRNLCKQGRKRTAEKLAYFEWCADKDDALEDKQAWAKANPALGYRISEEFTQSELDRLDDESFQRERLGVWPEDEFERVIDTPVWESLAVDADKTGDSETPIAIAADVTPDRKFTAISAASLMEDGSILLEVIDMLPGTAWVVPRLKSLVDKHNPCVVVIDSNSPATSLIPDLKEEGLLVTKEPTAGDEEIIVKTTLGEFSQACGLFFDAVTGNKATETLVMDDGEEIEVTARGIRHLDDPALNEAVEGVEQKPIGDSWVWSRKTSASNIAPLVSATLALYGLVVYGQEEDVEPFVFFGR